MPQHNMAISAVSIPSERKVFYLTNVSFNEAKHEVLVEFSNKFEKFVMREKFFPFILLSHFGDKEKLIELILSFGFKGFSLEEEGDLFCLKALTFSDLKKIGNALALNTSKYPIILSPERSFLVSKNWSYFDAFERIDNLLFKLNPKSDSYQKGVVQKNIDFGFFLTKSISFNEALNSSEEEVRFLVDSAAWSNLLLVPITRVPKSINDKLELFLENIFFKHGELISFDSGGAVYSSNGFEPLGGRETFSKIDFSSIWAELFSKNFFNIGPETKNCSCCKPFVLEAKNLLPSSMIKVKFGEDNVYYESSSDSFAVSFHNSHPFKGERLMKKKEFFLSSFPIGPFFNGDKVLVPLMDAKRLIDEKKAVLVLSSSEDLVKSVNGEDFDEHLSCKANEQNNSKLHELNWFCLNTESFFSKEVRRANLTLFSLRNVLDESNSNLFQSRSFSKIYSAVLYNSLSLLLAELPNQLTNPNSKFFHSSLAKSIISVQEATIAKFKEFSENKGYRLLHANKNSAFVKGFSSLKLAKEFAKETALPQPKVAKFIRNA